MKSVCTRPSLVFRGVRSLEDARVRQETSRPKRLVGEKVHDRHGNILSFCLVCIVSKKGKINDVLGFQGHKPILVSETIDSALLFSGFSIQGTAKSTEKTVKERVRVPCSDAKAVVSIVLLKPSRREANYLFC